MNVIIREYDSIRKTVLMVTDAWSILDMGHARTWIKENYPEAQIFIFRDAIKNGMMSL